MTRGQANLPALAVAALLVVGALSLCLFAADAAFAGADRRPGERHAALALSERLVAADGPLARDANVLDRAALRGLDAAALRRSFPVSRGYDVRVGLDGRKLVRTGPVAGGVTVRRVVLAATEQRRTLEPRFAGGARNVTLPRRTDRVAVVLDPPPATTVRTVWVGGRVALHDPSGLDGRYVVRTSRFETVRVRFVAAGPLPRGSVRLAYFPERTTKGVLSVTVDA